MTSIQDLAEKIKGYVGSRVSKIGNIPEDIFLGLIIVLVALGSFGLGRLSKIEGSKAPVRFENVPKTQSLIVQNEIEKDIQNPSEAGVLKQAGELVGSKNGKKYYYSWCAGVQKISPANLIHFVDKAEAEARGYTPSASCKGL